MRSIVTDPELDKLQAQFNKLHGLDSLQTIDELQARFDKLAGVERKSVAEASKKLIDARMLVKAEMRFPSHATESLVKSIDGLMQANKNALAATIGKIDPESTQLRTLVGTTVKLMEQAKNHLVEENEFNLPLRQKITLSKQTTHEVIKELNQVHTVLHKALNLSPHKAVPMLKACIADYKKALHNAAEALKTATYLPTHERFKIVTAAERHQGFLVQAQKALEQHTKELIEHVVNLPSPPTGTGPMR